MNTPPLTEQESAASIRKAMAKNDFALAAHLFERHETWFSTPAATVETRPLEDSRKPVFTAKPPVDPNAPHVKMMAPPCPQAADLTMAEATLWDNWGSDQRPVRTDIKGRNRAPVHRYGLEFHGWTLDPDNVKTLRQLTMPGLQHFSTSTRLFPVESMAVIVPEMVKRGKIDQAYADELMGVVDHYRDSAVKIGLFSGNGASTKGVGKAYIPHQFVAIEVFEGKNHAAMPETCRVHINGEILNVTGWTNKRAGSDTILEHTHTKTGETPLYAARMDLSGKYRWSGWDSRVV